MDKDHRNLNVTSCEVLRRGANAESGREWTMYEVFAVDEAGTPIEAKLRAFDPLPLNQLVLYKITKRVDQRHGTSYTLEPPKEFKPKRQPSKGNKERIDELTLRADDIDQRFEWLLNELHKLQRSAGVELSTPQPQSGATAPISAPPGSSPALAGNDEIPF